MADSVLISGATGLIGRRVVRALAGEGCQIRALTRDPRRGAATLDPRHVLVPWDGLHVPADALRGCSAMVHLAGEPIFAGPLTAGRRRRIYESRIASTRSIAQTLGGLPASERPATLVCASAVGFYGSRGEESLDESCQPGSGFLPELCRDWEAAAGRAQEHGLRVVSLRFGIALAREGGALPPMARIFRLGLGGRLGSGDQWMPWIQLDDAVSLLVACLRDARLAGPVNAVSPEPVRNRDFTRALAHAVGRPALLPVPGFALRMALRDLADELLGSRRVVPARARAVGFRFAYEALGPALAHELSRSPDEAELRR